MSSERHAVTPEQRHGHKILIYFISTLSLSIRPSLSLFYRASLSLSVQSRRINLHLRESSDHITVLNTHTRHSRAWRRGERWQTLPSILIKVWFQTLSVTGIKWGEQEQTINATDLHFRHNIARWSIQKLHCVNNLHTVHS